MTRYDMKQSKKLGYNHYALSLYLERIDLICADVEKGVDVRAAIVAGFSGRVADACLKAVELSSTTKSENTGGTYYYEAVTAKNSP